MENIHTYNGKKPVTKGYAKTPVVVQMEPEECGAACLAMVLAYYDKWVSLAQVCSDCGISRDGSKLGSILNAALGYGLEASGMCMEAVGLKEKGKFPCIIQWNVNQFVVLNGFRNGKVMITDPSGGSYKVSWQTFVSSYEGWCILLSPGDAFETGGKQTNMLSYARKRLTGSFTAVIFLITTTAVTSLIGIINPVFSRIFLDRLLTEQNPEWAGPFFVLLMVTILLQLGASWLNAIYLLRLNGKMSVVGNSSFFWHVLHMPMEFFFQRMAGDLQERQEINGQIAETLIDIFTPILLNAAMMVFYLVVMLRYSPLLAAIGLTSICINMGLSQIISRKRVNISRRSVKNKNRLSAVTVSGIKMIDTIKASGAENGFFEKWVGYQNSLNNSQVGYVMLNQYLGIIPNLINSLSNALILLIGIYLVMQGEFTIGMIMAFQGFLTSFMTPAKDLIAAGEELQEMRAQMETVEDVMTYPVDAVYKAQKGKYAEDDPKKYQKLSGNIEIRNLTYGYSRQDNPLVEDFNLTLKQGGSVAFVGTSGCGKSTISKMIAGLYVPWSGEILFDGVPLTEIDRDTFIASLAVVDQDIVLFEDTIANNIKMWDDSIEDFEMILAARDAKLHDDIMQRDEGYQYRITEGGRDFSGGQRQRLEIARALAQDPAILIMDEATSALDAKTEYDVVRAVRDRGITCIIIAHRLSTIRDCDEIIVLDHGKIVERGTHEELFAAGGMYTKLVKNE